MASKHLQTHQQLDVNYLTKQNRKLRMQLAEAIKLKQLHQQVLIEINQQYPQSSVIKTLVNIINQTANENTKNKQNQYLMQLQGKLMVLQKISQQTEENEKQTYNLLAEEFQKLKSENTKISEQLHKFYEKIGQVDYISGLVTKYKQLLTPSQQTMAFKKQQQQLLDALNLQQEMIKKISEEKDKLLRINVFMKEEVERKKEEVRNMTIMFMNGDDMFNGQDNEQVGNVLDQLDDNQQHQSKPVTSKNSQIATTLEDQHRPSNQSAINVPLSQRSSFMPSSKRINMSKMNSSLLMQNNPNTTLNFIKMQRQLLKDVKEEQDENSSFTNESELSDCPQLSILFPDKVQKIIKTKQKSKVPYLNMKKVRQMMAKREQKMRKQWQQQKHHINPTNKIITLETELDITRKQLANQSLKFRLMQDQLKKLRVNIQELEKRNQLLVESNFRLKTNYQVVYKDYQLCKSITMQVERALGMVIGRENEHKVRQKLGILLADKLQLQRQLQLQNKAQGKELKQKKVNRRPKQTNTETIQNEQQQQQNSLESTFRDQLRQKRFMEIFSCQNTHTFKYSQTKRALSQ